MSFLKETKLIGNNVRHVLIDDEYYFYVRDITEKYPEVKIVNFDAVKYYKEEPVVRVKDMEYKTPFEKAITDMLKKKSENKKKK